MKKTIAVILFVLLVGTLAAGCGGNSASTSPMPTPTLAPSATSTLMPSASPTVMPELIPSGSAQTSPTSSATGSAVSPGGVSPSPASSK